MYKRYLSLTLALFMILSLFPMAVYAADTDGSYGQPALGISSSAIIEPEPGDSGEDYEGSNYWNLHIAHNSLLPDDFTITLWSELSEPRYHQTLTKSDLIDREGIVRIPTGVPVYVSTDSEEVEGWAMKDSTDEGAYLFNRDTGSCDECGGFDCSYCEPLEQSNDFQQVYGNTAAINGIPADDNNLDLHVIFAADVESDADADADDDADADADADADDDADIDIPDVPAFDDGEFRYFTDNCSWCCSNGTLAVRGTEVPGYYSQPWYGNYFNTLVVEEGINSIGYEAFASNGNLRTVYLPSTVETISYRAFARCNYINTVYYNGTVDSWIDHGFANGVELPLNANVIAADGKLSDREYYTLTSSGTLIFPGDSVIDNRTVSKLSNVKNYVNRIVIEDGVNAICNNAFQYFTNLKSVSIADSVTSIGNYAFSGCTKLESVTIPSSVTKLGYDAFFGCSSLKNAVISGDIECIDSSAFHNCSALETVSIPASVRSIYSGAFYGASALNTVYFGGTVAQWNNIYIGNENSPLYTCNYIVCSDGTIDNSHPSGEKDGISWEIADRTLTLSGSGKVLENGYYREYYPWYKYAGTYSTVDIGEGITELCNEAFASCGNLSTVRMPSTIENVDGRAFNNSRIDTIYYNGTIDDWTDLRFVRDNNIRSREVVCDDGNLSDREHFSFSSSGVLTFPGDAVINRNTADKLDNIGRNNIERIVIEDGVKYICRDAFSGCRYMTDVSIPDSVEYIASYAFYYCSRLTSIVIPDGVEEIGEYTFYNCRNLKSVTIPASVTAIDYAAFNECDNLKNVYFGGTMEQWRSIDAKLGAFDAYAEYDVFCTDGVLYFDRYGGIIKNVTWRFSSGGNLRISGEGPVIDALNYSASDLPWYDIKYNVNSLTVDEGITGLSRDVFVSCANLYTVNLPSTIESIDGDAFRNCYNIERINYNDTTERWGELGFSDSIYCFEGVRVCCTNGFYGEMTFTFEDGVLTFAGGTRINEELWQEIDDFSYDIQEVIIPDGATYIGEYVFCNCYNLEKITVPASMTEVGDSAFQNIDRIGTVNFGGTIEQWNSIDFGNRNEALKYADKIECADGTIDNYNNIGENISYSFTSSGTLIISGSGAIRDNARFEDIYDSNYDVKSVIISEGITRIGNNAFENFYVMKEITLPSTLKEIGKYAFHYCQSLEKIDLPDNLEKIDDGAFCGCHAEKVIIPDSVTYLGDHLFLDSRIDHIAFPEGMSVLAYETLLYSSVRKIELPGTLTTIEYSAVGDALKEIVFNGTMEQWYAVEKGENNSALYLAVIYCTDGVIDNSRNCGYDGSNIFWSLSSSGVLTISGEGNMMNYTDESIPYGVQAPWHDQRSSITKVDIKGDVYSIGNYAFCDCNNLTEIEIENPENIYFGYMAVRGCTSLALSELPGMEAAIRGGWFIDRSGISSVEIPDGTYQFNMEYFEGCSDLTTVYLPGSIMDCYTWYEDLPPITDIYYDGTIDDWNEVNSYLYSQNIHCNDGDIIRNVCGDNAYWRINSNACDVIDIYGEGATYSFAEGHSPWSEYVSREYVYRVNVEEGITALNGYCFSDCTDMCYISLPESLESIDDMAFTGCSNLWEIGYAGTVEMWYSHGFNNVESLNNISELHIYCTDGDFYINSEDDRNGMCGDNVSWRIINYTLTISGSGPMYDYGAADEEYAPWEWLYYDNVVIGDGVTYVGNNAFNGDRSVLELTLPAGIEINKEYWHLSGYTVNFGGTMDEWEAMPITEKSYFETVNCSDGTIDNTYRAGKDITVSVTSSGTLILSGSGAMYDGVKLWRFEENAEIKSAVVGEGITSISDHAFAELYQMRDVSLPTTLKEIGNFAFASCYSLGRVELPAGVEHIGEYAFAYIKADEFVISDGITELPARMIYPAEIGTLYIPASVEKIGEYCVSEVNNVVFMGTMAQWNAIEIGEGNGVFKLNYILCTDGTIDNSRNCGYDGDNITWSFSSSGVLTLSGSGEMRGYWGNQANNRPWENVLDKITKVVADNSITSIGYGAFAGCENLAVLDVPEFENEYAANYAFTYCPSLDLDDFQSLDFAMNSGYYIGHSGVYSFELPDGYTYIDMSMFTDCYDLHEVWLPGSVTGIYGYAENCNITDVYYDGTSEEWQNVYNYAFRDGPTIHFLKGGDPISGSCGDNVRWAMSSGSLVVYGSGPMYEYNSGNRPWAGAERYDGLYKVIIEDGVTEINGSVFASSADLKLVTIPAGMESISETAFRGDYVISVEYGGTMESWYEHGFDEIEGLHNAYTTVSCLDGTIKPTGSSSGTCGRNVSWYMTGGSLVIYGSGPMDFLNYGTQPWLEYIRHFHFTSVQIDEGVTAIRGTTFASDANLKGVHIPASMESIDLNAFSGARNINYVSFGGTMAQWYERGFDKIACLNRVGLQIHCIDGIIGDKAHSGSVGENVSWAISGGTLVISGSGAMDYIENTAAQPWNGYGNEFNAVTIEEGVTNVRGRAFASGANIQIVRIPHSMQSIDGNSFDECRNISAVFYNGTMAEWYEHGFNRSAGFEHKGIMFYFADGTSMCYGDYDFGVCGDNVAWAMSGGNLVISGRGPTYDFNEEYAPWSWHVLDNVIIKDGVTRLGENAFINNYEVYSVTLPAGIELAPYSLPDTIDTVNYGGTMAQWNALGYSDSHYVRIIRCSDGTIDNSNRVGKDITWSFTSSGTLVLSGSGAMYDHPPYSFDVSNVRNVIVGEGITSLGIRAFAGFEAMRSIALPTTLKGVGLFAFSGCISLESIVLPEGLEFIDGDAFNRCQFNELVVPASVTSFGGYPFEFAVVDRLVLNSEITKLPEGLFDASTIGTLELNNSITSIGENCFEYCNIGQIVFHGTIAEWNAIDKAAYNSQLYLNNIICDDGIIDNSHNCGFDGDKVTWSYSSDGVLTISGEGRMRDYYPGIAFERAPWTDYAGSIRKIVVEDGVTWLGCTYDEYPVLTELDIPDYLWDYEYFGDTLICGICEDAFVLCPALELDDFPDAYMALYCGFYNERYGVTSFEVPEGVTYLWAGKFYSCYDLRSLYLPSTIERVSGQCDQVTDVYYNGTMAQWAEVENDSFLYQTIHCTDGDIVQNRCGDNATWSYVNGKLTISGSGDMWDYSSEFDTPWYCYSWAVDTIIVESGITGIGDNAFNGLENARFADIPEGVTRIGFCAFASCGNLVCFHLPASLETVDPTAFNYHVQVLDFEGTREQWDNIDFGWGFYFEDTTVNCLGDMDVQGLNLNPSAGEHFFASGDCTRAGLAMYLWNAKGCPEPAAEVSHYTSGGGMITYNHVDLNDVSTDAPYYKAVRWCVLNGYMNTVGGMFYPDAAVSESGNCTKAEVAVYLWNEKGCPEPAAEVTVYTSSGNMTYNHVDLDDVSSDADYYKAVRWCVLNGYMSTLDGMFYPDSNVFTSEDCTRAGLAMYLWNAKGCPEPAAEVSHYTSYGGMITYNHVALNDVSTDADYYKAVRWCVMNGYMNTDDGMFYPDESVCKLDVIKAYYAVNGNNSFDAYELPFADVIDNYYYGLSDYEISAIRYAYGIGLIWPDANGMLNPYAVCDACADVHVHSYTAVVVEPTCIEQGYTVYTCECGDSYVSDYVEALGHSTELCGAVEATCFTEGYTGDVCCSVCGEVLEKGTAIPKLPVTVSSNPEDGSGLPDDIIEFSVNVSGEKLAYRWQVRANDDASWANTYLDGCNTATLKAAVKTYRDGYQYRCIVTDLYGNEAISETGVLHLKPCEAVIISQPSDYVGRLYETARFEVVAEGEGLRYQWYYSNDGISWGMSYSTGSTTSVFEPMLNATASGRLFRCEITDRYGMKLYSEPAMMYVDYSDITVISQPESYTGKLNDLAEFSVVAEATNLSYRWQVSSDGGNTWVNSENDGYDTPDLRVRLHEYRDGYMYRCVLTSGCKNDAAHSCVVISDPVTIHKIPRTVKITKYPENAYCNLGDTARFSVKATGEGLMYQWQFSNNGEVWADSGMEGARTPDLKVPALAYRNGQMYRCKVTDNSGSFDYTLPVVLNIGTLPVINHQPESRTAALNSNAVFHVDAQGSGLTYQWYYRSNEASDWVKSEQADAVTDTLTVAVRAYRNGFQYRCEITNADGMMVRTEQVTLTIAGSNTLNVAPNLHL